VISSADEDLAGGFPMYLFYLLAIVFVVTMPWSAGAVPSLVERVMDGVYVVHDDSGQWGGHMSNSITHQSRAEYQAKKVLDLSDVPAEVWEQTKAVRLSAYFMVRDYSWHDRPPANGLDEALEVVVNGHVHTYPTNCGAPVFAEGQAPTIAWYDFTLPQEEFVRGPNEILLRKAPSDKNDDYLYLGIDNSVKRGNSFVSFDGQTWTQERLTVPGGNGEYMVRLYLITKETRLKVIWQPGLQTRLEDPEKLIAYVGARRGKATAAGLRLPAGESARMEWLPLALDLLEPVKVTVEASGDVQFAWLDEAGKPTEAVKGPPPLTQELPANRTRRPSGLTISAMDTPVILTSVTLEAARSYHPLPRPIDMCPRIAPPKGKAARRLPSCRQEGRRIILENRGLRVQFTHDDHLRLTSLYNEYTACEMVREPSQVYLFLVEVEEAAPSSAPPLAQGGPGGVEGRGGGSAKRYAGSRDFRCASVKPGKNGFTADLRLDEPTEGHHPGLPLQATLTVTMESEGLRLGLSLANAGTAPVAFKLAFPHFAGLTVSGNPAEDYYFFPWGGGIFADTPALIRRGYGDHEALYQVMDLFSPARGGGLSVRADDHEGWHKTLALRKHIPGAGEVNEQRTYVQTADEYKWTNPLEAVEGLGFAYEYLRRTRAPGQAFVPAEAVLAAHPGDWHAAMKSYADWAHRVWKFRPYPSRLKSVHHMIAAGWAGDFLFRDGKYRTDFIKPETDCIELMSWWDWSPLGPWSTPFDRLSEVLTEAQIKMWQPYFVKDPVTGQTMWNDQPGDYAGYNERFGGLPAFRQAIQTYQDLGALVTLYTDPFRLDDACPTGQKYGKLWGVVGPDGKHTRSYDVWNPCHDNPDVRQWVADTMKRVMRETGADGIRLDEYGHVGWACFSDLHPHTYAERGVTQWNKAVAEATRMVHAAMDEVRPDLVLTTEHPGYDYLMQFLEGCITYDLTVQACSLRPLECNLQRFYFPECKAYELDHRGADPQDKKKFWNAVESFGRYYPTSIYTILKENEDVYQSRDGEPLIPTLARYVYAHRFSGGGKTIYHLYNATGHTFDGEALAVTLKPGEHLFDLLNGQECEVVKQGREPAVRLYLPRDEVACIAKLTKRLAVTRKGRALQVEAKSLPGPCRLVISDRRGRELLSQEAKAGRNGLDLAPLPAEAQPAGVKLLGDGLLLDVAAVPGE